MIWRLIQLGAIAATFFFDKMLDYLDWRGRAELLEQRHPRIWSLIQSRLARLLLALAIISFLARDFHDAVAIAPPPNLVVKTPSPPAIVENESVREFPAKTASRTRRPQSGGAPRQSEAHLRIDQIPFMPAADGLTRTLIHSMD